MTMVTTAIYEVKNTHGERFINAMLRIEKNYGCWVEPIDLTHVYIEMPSTAEIMVSDILRFYKTEE